MASGVDWKIPVQVQPKPDEVEYDLERALSSVVTLSAHVPADAFTASTLGTERGGYAVMIDERGILLTIGYLITEAETIWLSSRDGQVAAGHVLGYDQATGFGLVQSLSPLDVPVLPIGSSKSATLGTPLVIAGAGGRARAVSGQVVARQEFAGYWEYVLDEAIFTAPSHPHWGGTAAISPDGKLVGIGSLQLQGGTASGRVTNINMIVPIDLLKPIYDDLVTKGRADHPPRPWLGLFAAEHEDKIAIIGLSDNGPAERAGLKPGDLVVAVGGQKVDDLASFFRGVWARGEAGIDVPLTLVREGDRFDVTVRSGDRSRFLKSPRIH